MGGEEEPLSMTADRMSRSWWSTCHAIKAQLPTRKLLCLSAAGTMAATTAP